MDIFSNICIRIGKIVQNSLFKFSLFKTSTQFFKTHYNNFSWAISVEVATRDLSEIVTTYIWDSCEKGQNFYDAQNPSILSSSSANTNDYTLQLFRQALVFEI